MEMLKKPYFEMGLIHYIETFDRNQMMMATWDSIVDFESTARLTDAFVDSLDLAGYGVKEIAPTI